MTTTMESIAPITPRTIPPIAMPFEPLDSPMIPRITAMIPSGTAVIKNKIDNTDSIPQTKLAIDNPFFFCDATAYVAFEAGAGAGGAGGIDDADGGVGTLASAGVGVGGISVVELGAAGATGAAFNILAPQLPQNSEPGSSS